MSNERTEGKLNEDCIIVSYLVSIIFIIIESTDSFAHCSLF